jgi:vacuolar-type H+-ATPase subunit I/STV1
VGGFTVSRFSSVPGGQHRTGIIDKRDHTAMEVNVTVSVGELLDKITILQIKQERIQDPRKRANVTKELNLLTMVRDAQLSMTGEIVDLITELKSVNESLWDIEDKIRDCERAKDFGDQFISLARAVYLTNDRRAALKTRLNSLTGSAVVEEKSYQAY